VALEARIRGNQCERECGSPVGRIEEGPLGTGASPNFPSMASGGRGGRAANELFIKEVWT